MKTLRLVLLSSTALCFAHAAWAQELQLKRVMLSLGGVGYFEFEARVEGNAQLNLPVRLDQVDDVLKSVVVFDDRGAVGQITLPGRAPLDQAFKDLPFTQAALASYDQLLNALTGAEITVTGQRAMTGRILSVVAENARLPNDSEIVRHRATLVTAEGMRQFWLDEAETVRFADPALQQQVDEALAAIARHRVQDKRTLSVTAEGSGARTLRVGYVVGTPLWKTSYRLSVPESGDKGQLQGWAVVENLSGQDWSKVDLTLASGNPVTFRQQLYQAYFVNRPEVPVDVLARVAPRADQGTIAMSRGAAAMAPAPAPAAMAPFMRERAEAMKQADIVTGEVQEGATQVLFNAPEPVSVRSGDTLMLPIVNKDLPVERLALYQPAVHAANPLAALRLTNDTGFGLPPGLTTIYERGSGGAAHVGDARLGLTPTRDSRLLSFAVDYKIAADRESRPGETTTQIKVADGVLTLISREQLRDIYRFRRPANDNRAILIEHPRLPGWDLVTPKEAELSGNAYRVRLPAGTASTEIVSQRTNHSVMRLAETARESLLGYAKNGELTAEQRKTFEDLAKLQGEVERLEAQIRDGRTESDRIAKDQERIRQNLGSVPSGSDLAKRYLAQLKTQEDRLDQIRATEADATQKLSAAREARNEFISRIRI